MYIHFKSRRKRAHKSWITLLCLITNRIPFLCFSLSAVFHWVVLSFTVNKENKNKNKMNNPGKNQLLMDQNKRKTRSAYVQTNYCFGMKSSRQSVKMLCAGRLDLIDQSCINIYYIHKNVIYTILYYINKEIEDYQIQVLKDVKLLVNSY